MNIRKSWKKIKKKKENKVTSIKKASKKRRYYNAGDRILITFLVAVPLALCLV